MKRFSLRKLHHQFKQRIGFTLVEVIVSLTLIIVVTVFATANFQHGRRQTSLKIETGRLAQTVREAKTRALAGAAFEGQVPRDGYGVYVDLTQANDKVMVYGDTGTYSAQPGDFVTCTATWGGWCVKVVELDQGHVISSATVVKDTVPSTTVSVSSFHAIFNLSTQQMTIRTNFYETNNSEARLIVASTVDPSVKQAIVISRSGEVAVRPCRWTAPDGAVVVYC